MFCAVRLLALFVLAVYTLAVHVPTASVLGQTLPTEDLVLWLDASDESTFDVSDDGLIKSWRDKSPEHHDALAEKIGPLLVKGEGSQSTRVRFTHNDRPTPLRLPALAEKLGPITIFVIAQRNKEQSGRGKWQRLFSIRELEQHDNKGNGLAMTLKLNGGEGAFSKAIYAYTKPNVAPNAATLGTTALGQPGGGLLADVSEVIVYARSIDDHTEFEQIQDYLAKKWDVNVARDVGGWIRPSALPKTLEHKTADLPLFDQANQGGWRKVPEMSDEFAGKTLDDEKWWDHYPAWHGRVPARFLPENIKVADGNLSLTLRKDTTLPREHLHNDVEGDYFDYSAAAVVSKTAITYGCFEVRVKPAHATCTSSFWFNGGAVNQDEVQRKGEIDVFELAAGHEGSERKFGMNMHVFKEPESEGHWSNWGNWEAPFNWSEDFHTVNLVWSPGWIRYYVDGHCVRTTRNVAWHVPLQMIFDMEIMAWLPHPEDWELPATYEIDYVRSWTRDDWVADPAWTPILDPKKETGVTKAVRDLTEQRMKTKPAAHLSNAAPDVRKVIKESFAQTHEGWSSDEVVLRDDLNKAFVTRCLEALPDSNPAELNWRLLNMRKAGLLKVPTTRSNRKSVTRWKPIAEIVARVMIDKHKVSIDKIMTTPKLKKEFDSAVLEIDADADLYGARKAAFGLRKQRRLKPELIARIADWGREISTLPLKSVRANGDLVPELPGIYIFRDETGYLYIGQSENLRSRLKEHLDQSSNFSLAKYLADQQHDNVTIELHAFAGDSRAKETMIRRAYESELIDSRKPKFNIQP